MIAPAKIEKDFIIGCFINRFEAKIQKKTFEVAFY